MTVAEAENISGKQYLIGFIFMQTSQLTRMIFGVVFKQFKLNVFLLLKNEIYVIKRINLCFPDCIEKLRHARRAS